jgi:hypothetical protein
MHLHDLLLPITVPTGQVRPITEVQAAVAQQEPTVHLQLLPGLEVLIKEVLLQEAAAAVTAAVALHLQGVTHRVVRVAPAVAGHLHLRLPHQAEEDNPMVATTFSINKKEI